MRATHALAAPMLAIGLTFFSGCAKQMQTDLDTARSALAAAQADLAACRDQLGKADTAKALADKRLAAYRDLAGRLREALGVDNIEIILRNGRMVVQLPNNILFDSGKAELKQTGKETLSKLATVILAVDRDFLIAGHTDNVPIGSKESRFRSNWELSTLRATTAVEFLQSKGVPPTHLGAAGYGEFKPDATNDTDEGKAENRRLEIIVMPRLDEILPLPKEL